jgi:quinol---cytochrome c reductase iron-sulfur subunit
MNEQDTIHPGSEVAPSSQHGTAVRLDQGHVVGDGGLPERFTNPGLPEHVARMADLDESAARRAEKQVATLFGISILGTLAFIVCYFAISLETTIFVPGIGETSASNFALGVSMALGLLGIGFGAVHWAKTLMPDSEVVEERHALRGSDEVRAEAVEIVRTGGEESGIGRRPLIRNSLLGALALFPLPGLVVLRDLGPLPGDDLAHTLWGEEIADGGDVRMRRLTRDPSGRPIKAAEVTQGSVFHVIPEGLNDVEHALEEKAKAAVLLVRLDPKDVTIPEGREDWHVDGIFAYSKICTHVGCPVALYEQQTHHLLCPCHQSTFDMTDHCKVIFGPAKRPLPQLPITVDDEGYLVATADFPEPTGPSFFERGER